MQLNFGFEFTDLYKNSGLKKLDFCFLSFLKNKNSEAYKELKKLRLETEISKEIESKFIIELAPIFSEFLTELFSLEKHLKKEQKNHLQKLKILDAKRLFIQRRAIKKYPASKLDEIDLENITEKLTNLIGEFSEEKFANLALDLIENPDANEDKIDVLSQYASYAIFSEVGKQNHKNSVLFSTPKKNIFENLIPYQKTEQKTHTEITAHSSDLRYRDGFKLTENAPKNLTALSEAHYCIFCHNRGKDSCSHGLKDKEGSFKKSPGNVTLNGCPLEEKISEMNYVKSLGNNLGAFAIAIIDNPMLAATGHRICNDCMKACIYQTQDPVNIPLVESQILDEVLSLPYGFEIYSLLTRWNPLNLLRPLPKPNSNYKVLVAGLGPAGFTLSHHLLNDGHLVTAIDGLKIEPLPSNISGIDSSGKRAPFQPIKDVKSELYEDLDKRVNAGFGGVAEYGITVRWNKNYLKLIRLLLERRNNFRMYGGVRFGSQITKEIAFKELGFDHLALCMGAGSPTIISLKNNLSRGVRKASDFLMALQLTGAYKFNSIANLQVRLPVVVIGGGLTAIDTATEALAYYPRQVEKFLERYQILCKENAEESIRKNWDAEENEIADEFISHAKAILAEKKQAAKEKRDPNILQLINDWGGVKILYRKSLTESPSYRLNHEEVEKALEEGISFIGDVTPHAVLLDSHGAASSLDCLITSSSPATPLRFPARTVLIAAGTKPNTVLAGENNSFKLSKGYFRAIDSKGREQMVELSTKPQEVNIITHRESDKRSISFLGDMHPSYNGNVVKAMAGSKQGAPVITKELQQREAVKTATKDFFKNLDKKLIATIHDVIRLTPNIIEIIVHAPLAAENFKPGQFYRLQNFDSLAPEKLGTKLTLEGIALTGASTNLKKGLISLIILEMGGSSNLCASLKKNEPVILMGPTGTPTEIYQNKTVLLVGGGLGNAVLFSIGKALRAAGSKTLYFAGYKKAVDRYKMKEIEEAADVVVWACDELHDFKANRPQDKIFHGNIIEAMIAYGKGELGKTIIALSDTEHVIAIGSSGMMQAVKQARSSVLQQQLSSAQAVGSINSPMQCMMKEICAQCLQKHLNPITGEEYFVYSCSNQDQDLDRVDFPHLHSRLKQNSLQEKLIKDWVEHVVGEG